MGILDSLENNPALRSALGQLGAAVLPAVLSEVLGSNNQGGLGAIVAKLQQAGFGDQVKSWLGNGQNLPISADQLAQRARQRYRPPIGCALQHPGRPAGSDSGPGTAQGGGPRQPQRSFAEYRLRSRFQRYHRLAASL